MTLVKHFNAHYDVIGNYTWLLERREESSPSDLNRGWMVKIPLRTSDQVNLLAANL
jgi:hypothetical protein